MSPACSELSLRAGEPLAGTAPTALTWVVVEHPGPWGRDAIADAALPDRARAALQALKAAGAGVLLARRPWDRRAATPGHEVLLARSAPGGSLLRRVRIPDLTELASWDADAVARGQLPAVGEPAHEPVLLVCTQGRRDACCAVAGRGLLSALRQAQDAPGTEASTVEVWESSHIGGHRLAPVTLALPSGAVHGRLPADRAAELLDATGREHVLLEHLRGCTALPAPLQAADLAVRRAIAEPAAGALDVLLVTTERAVATGHDWRPAADPIDVEVRHADGRSWRAHVRRVQGASRPESCGQQPVPMESWQVDSLSPAGAWR